MPARSGLPCFIQGGHFADIDHNCRGIGVLDHEHRGSSAIRLQVDEKRPIRRSAEVVTRPHQGAFQRTFIPLIERMGTKVKLELAGAELNSQPYDPAPSATSIDRAQLAVADLESADRSLEDPGADPL